MLNYDLLKILACPLCKGGVVLDKENSELICNKCKLAYEIKGDIPIMLIDKARKIDAK